MQLMFRTKNAGTLSAASARLFATVTDLIVQGQRVGALPPGDPERLRLLMLATLQGIAELLISERVSTEQADTLVSDAVALFTRST
jgi:hypothetical protein